MRGVAIFFGLGVALAAADADAAAPCPAWRDRATMDCMRGYLRVDPAGMTVLERQVGYASGLAAGVFRAFAGESLAFGGRVAYGLFREPGSSRVSHMLQLRPELRVGVARERVFGYALMYGGFTRLSGSAVLPRTSIVPLPEARPGWHIGAGAGAWWRVKRRLLLGVEGVVEGVHVEDSRLWPAFSLYLSVGSWL